MIALDPEQAVARGVAGGNERVVGAARRVLDEGQDGPSLVREERVAAGGPQLHEPRAAGLHRHPLRDVERAECPGVDYLRAVGIDDLDALAGGHPRRRAAPGGYREDLRGRHRSVLLVRSQLPATEAV